MAYVSDLYQEISTMNADMMSGGGAAGRLSNRGIDNQPLRAFTCHQV